MMNRYLVGAYVIGARTKQTSLVGDDVAQAVVIDRAAQSQKARAAADEQGTTSSIIGLGIGAIVALVAWPWIKRNT